MGQCFEFIPNKSTISPPRPAPSGACGAGHAVHGLCILAAPQGLARPAQRIPFRRNTTESLERDCVRRSASRSRRPAAARSNWANLRPSRQHRLRHRERTLGLDRAVPGQRIAAARRPHRHESAAPEPHGILAHAEGLAIRGFVQPARVSRSARARSASPRSRESG